MNERHEKWGALKSELSSRGLGDKGGEVSI